ncbi:hypothetical protein PYW08_008006 [Mythimna loreyi]|uniref:Uncharacterized protein n=1 Tax=Mythimna loreyi TaxID=667449 RepID=A0ACC2QC55_9NEOP|nr:hypothetical protein PYW08_008006 [Mythimna loreyi]
MFKKLGFFVIVLTVLQVSARHKNVELDLVDDKINPSDYFKSETGDVSSSSSRIVSGWEAQPGQHPHHAALHMVNSTGPTRLCGGSIIAKEWILTNARCVISCVLAIVRVGVVSIADSNPDNIFLTTEWYSHPSFNNVSGVTLQSHGVALIKLQRPIVYTELAQRIRLQSSADAYRDYDGLLAYASGHGVTSQTGPISVELRWVYLRAISNSQCRNIYTGGVFDTIICARYFNVTSQSTCIDDLGGPLVHVESDGVPTLIGITYFYPGGTCESGQPSGYYRPGAFLSWFEEVTGIDFENLQDEDETTEADTTTTTTTTAHTSITTPTTTAIPSTSTNLSTSTDSEDEDLGDFTTEDNTTLPPNDNEETEVEDNPDGIQNSKHRSVNVNVTVITNILQT